MVDVRSDRGQAMPWMVVVVLAALALVAFAVRFAAVVDDAAQARTAADAAALAGAAGGESSARDLATRNGGELLSFVRTWRGVAVEVRVGTARARAEASATTVWVPAPG
ncbi:MAG: pilus assembly protein TadG-related protein [Actinomycetota bacterium]